MADRKTTRARNKSGGSLLLPYQAAWVKDSSRLKLMEKSRQIGMSWSSAYALVRRKSLAGERYDAWVSSRDEAQAKLFLEDCKQFAGILDVAAEDLGVRLLDDGKCSVYTLRFANGVRINSMSSNPDAQAGKRGDRLLDEFALHQDQRKLYAVAYPGITWGGQLEIVSTHRGSATMFAELAREAREKGNPKGLSLHRVTLQDALDQGFLDRLQRKLPDGDPRLDMDEAAYFDYIRAGCADEETFLQEYMCVPADDASAFLEYGLIASCEYPSGEAWEPADLRACRDLYAGVDVGRRHDLTVIWVDELAGGRHLTRRVTCLRDTPFSEQRKVLWDLLRLPNMRRCCMDATGLGMQLAEEAQEEFGRYRVEAVTFSPRVKEALAYPLRGAFEDGNVRIPYDGAVRADLRKVRRTATAAGNVRFAADSDGDGHADRFWALALAVHAASGEGAEVGMEPLRDDARPDPFGHADDRY